MKHLIFSALITLFTGVLNGFAQAETCNCSENLQKLAAKTQENYAGFPAKVNPKTQDKYNKLLQKLQKEAAVISQPKACYYLLKSYIRFFEDKHFILAYNNENDFDNEQISLTETEFKNAYNAKKAAPIEGVWVNPEGTLKLAIKKTADKTFKAIVLESADKKLQAGLVYCVFTQTKNGFIAKEFDSFISTDSPARLRGNLLQIWNSSMFGRQFPQTMTATECRELDTWRNNNKGLDFKKLSDKTAYLKVTTFQANDDKIQALVAANDSIIRATDNLIVDLTGNGGGNTGWVAFLPYFLTNPVVQYSSFVRVTPENVALKLKDLEFFVLNPIPAEYEKYFPAEVLAAYKRAYAELPTTTQAFYPVPGVTFPLDTLLPKPKRIALLVDDLCGSSTEYFFSLSKQSTKTTTYGTNTIGMMDYEGMSVPTALPYGKYILTIPIVKSSWTDTAPIDKTGFTPDVSLKHLPIHDWVPYVQKQLEAQE